MCAKQVDLGLQPGELPKRLRHRSETFAQFCDLDFHWAILIRPPGFRGKYEVCQRRVARSFDFSQMLTSRTHTRIGSFPEIRGGRGSAIIEPRKLCDRQKASFDQQSSPRAEPRIEAHIVDRSLRPDAVE